MFPLIESISRNIGYSVWFKFVFFCRTLFLVLWLGCCFGRIPFNFLLEYGKLKNFSKKTHVDLLTSPRKRKKNWFPVKSLISAYSNIYFWLHFVCRFSILQGCRMCGDCGSRVPGLGSSSRWHLNFTVCDSCYQLRNKGLSCPICGRAYRHASQRDMVQCNSCRRWVIKLVNMFFQSIFFPQIYSFVSFFQDLFTHRAILKPTCP
jgi:hypothetical protein